MFDRSIGQGIGVARTPSQPEKAGGPAPTKSRAPETPTSRISSTTSEASAQAILPRYFDPERAFELLPHLRPSWIERLKARGVSEALAEGVRRGHVVFLDDGFFDFPEEAHGGHAQEAMLFLALDRLGVPADIVAWEQQGNQKASWQGRVPLLGMENVGAPRINPQGGLEVFRNPIDWLRAERNGVVVVNPRRAGPILYDARPLIAGSEEFGRYLTDLTTPKPPHVYVPRNSREAA